VSRVDFFRGDRNHWVRRSTEKNGLWLDGKLASQEEIDRLLGLSIVNLPHTIVLGQKQDLFFDLKPQAKLEILSETLDLDKWDARSQAARDKTKALESDHAMSLLLIQNYELQLRAENTALEQAKAQAKEWEGTRSQAEAKREKERDDLTKALTKATAAAGPFDLAYDSAETELRAARKDLMKKGTERTALLDAVMTAKVAATNRKKEYDDLKAVAESGVCPTCKQPIATRTHNAAEARTKLKTAKHKAEVASDRVIVRETAVELHDKVMERIRKSIVAFGEKSDAAKDKLDRLTAQIAEIKQLIAVSKASSRDDETNPYSAQVTYCRNQIKMIKANIAEEKEKGDKISRRIIRTRYWIDGFKQVRLYLLQETLEELQEVTQNLLPELGLAGWSVEYDIERETKAGGVSTGLSVKILKPGMSKAVRWEAWSGGEGQRLLIVGAIALSEVLLRRAGIECDLLVLDEPTRHMSKEGIDETVDYLIARGRDAQIFYVDHQVIESNRFASVITIEKDAKGAKIKGAET
jgi:DNA repair exonuclease SbcCD ATPase subunit